MSNTDTLPLPPLAERLMGAAEYLTARQIALLATIAAHPERSTGEIAAALRMPAGRVTRNTDKLCDGGLVERRQNGWDRRLVRLSATRAGRALLAEVGAAS